MGNPTPQQFAMFLPLRLIARITAGMGRLAMLLLALIVIAFSVPMVGILADWMVVHRGSTADGVLSYQWVDSDITPLSCSGLACGMATLPLSSGRQVGGVGSAMVTARMVWPTPALIEASPNSYLEVVGAIDALHPVVQRPADEAQEDTSPNEIRPLLLANEVQKDGRNRPVMVPTEGFVSAWTLEGDPGEPLTAWARPTEPDRNGHSQAAAMERSRQWRALKVRRLQFQPVPPVVEVDVLRVALLAPIQVGYVMVFDWQTGGVLENKGSQLVPSRSAVGVVTQVQEMGQYLRMKLQIPRTSPYGSGHWLWHRLDGVPEGAPTLPSDVRALFFKPADLIGATPDWWLLESLVSKLPEVDVMRAPAAAFDPSCVEPVAPSHSCVWASLQGVAVPVQVTVQPLAGGDLSFNERSAFAGKALRPLDWAALPGLFRRVYGSPSVPGSKPSRLLLDATTRTLLAPQPFLKAGMPVSVDARANGGAQ
jgi:hypothetical protein